MVGKMSTRSALLDSAEHLARSRGFDGFSYADLAREVGIRKPSVHHHFPTKADLALGLVQRYRERFVAFLERLSGEHEDGASRLTGYLDLYREALSGGEEVCLCVAFSAGRDSLTPEVLAEVRLFEEAGIAWLTEAFRRGAEDGSIADVDDPRSEAMAAMACVEGAQLLARSAKSVERFDAATQLLVERVR